jgi:hypothetical protein
MHSLHAGALSKEQNSSNIRSGDDKPIESSTEARPSLVTLMRTTTTVSDEHFQFLHFSDMLTYMAEGMLFFEGALRP